MLLEKVRFVNGLLPSKPTQYRAAVKSQSVITQEKLIENICNHSGQKASCVRAILAALPGAMNDYLEAGNAVQVDNLCTFKPRIKSKAVDDPEKCTARCIKSVSIRAIPIGQTKEMVTQFEFQMTATVVDGEAEEENENDD